MKRITVLAVFVFVFAGLFADEANGQSRRQIERERQRTERQRQRELERYQNGRYTNDRYDTGRSRSRSAGLNNAIAMGYQQGLIAGEYDRRKRKFNQSNVYRNTGASPYSGDPTEYDYLYRQGYLQGYEDGYSGRRHY
jgi:hypothetical protein